MPAATPADAREASRKYRAKHRDRVLARRKQEDRLKYRYGITRTDHTAMLLKQDGRCAVCGCEDKLVVDHDHATGEVRGLLCNGCNVGLGQFRDNPYLLARAADYLKEHL